MSQRAVLHLLCALGVFHKGQTALIESQHTVMAAVGDDACLNCQLMQTKDVVQVTWQKILTVGKKDLATYNKHFGQKVNTAFRGRVEFQDAGLQNSSIVIRNVTDQDKGCYCCLFNTYPDGALTGRTCLQLYELHEPVLHVRESNSTEEVVVSCSATGRPAPTVTLTVSHYNSTNTTNTINTNGTVTVTTTAVLSRLHNNSTWVGCAVRVLSGPQIEVYEMIPEVEQSPAHVVGVDSESDNSDFSFTWIIVLVCVGVCVGVCVAAAIAFFHKHQNRHKPPMKPPGCLESVLVPQKDSEENKKDTHEPRTPLMKQENEVRLRTPSGKKKNIYHPKSSGKGRQLFSSTKE